MGGALPSGNSGIVAFVSFQRRPLPFGRFGGPHAGARRCSMKGGEAPCATRGRLVGNQGWGSPLSTRQTDLAWEGSGNKFWLSDSARGPICRRCVARRLIFLCDTWTPKGQLKQSPAAFAARPPRRLRVRVSHTLARAGAKRLRARACHTLARAGCQGLRGRLRQTLARAF